MIDGSRSAVLRHLRTLIACAVLAVGAVPMAAEAAPHAELFLTGMRTASIDVTVGPDTRLHLDAVATSTNGRFVGFYVEAVDVPFARRTEAGRRHGVVNVRDWHAPGQAPVPFSFTPPDPSGNVLLPGRYRFYLLADGPSTVRIPTSGPLRGRLAPSRPAQAAAAADSDVLKSPIEASNTQPLRLSGARTVNFSGILLGDFRAYAGFVGACIRSPGGECGETRGGADGSFAGYFISPLADVTLAFAVGYQPGVLPPGEYVADQAATNATTIKHASAAAFTLTLT
jgi:hypothetical protein